MIARLSPTCKQDFGFFQGKKDFPIEQFVAHFAIE
jgi:hypothetical protein